MKAVIHATGAIGEVLGVEKRDGVDYVYFVSGLCKPISEVGFLIPCEQYVEDCTDWADFRREAAKDILCSMLSAIDEATTKDISIAIEIADELIKQLRDGQVHKAEAE